jgi:peptide-methionine (S)-S-oxide reductase
MQFDRSTGFTLPTFLAKGLVAFALLGTVVLWHLAGYGETATIVPPPTLDAAKPGTGRTQTAVLAGGCFWGVQGVFQHTKGVKRVLSGYSGGEAATAQYRLVGGGETGHAESVEIVFDPEVISYGRILQIFFSVAHDPTQLNRQGPDVGSQYRSAIFYADAEQQRIARAYILQLEAAHLFGRPIVTRIDPLKGFYPAEDYHQDFLTRHPDHPYILINDLPKVDNMKRMFPEAYQQAPVLTTAR